jgi:hypothetical protein
MKGDHCEHQQRQDDAHIPTFVARTNVNDGPGGDAKTDDQSNFGHNSYHYFFKEVTDLAAHAKTFYKEDCEEYEDDRPKEEYE